MTIFILDHNTAEKIAAGEVVERPLSAVKELIDNSIDAKATRISIEIIAGGKEYIKINDNGMGIPCEELPLAFLRHATSKITNIEDLERITTLGFRGEALPSISAVAKVRLISKPANQLAAGEICIHGGETISYQEIASRDGTTVIIENLFYNTPARLKFLKSESHEASLIADLVSEYALGYPEIAFEFISQGKKLIHTTGKGIIKEAIAEVWGKEIALNLINDHNENDTLHVEGYFSPVSLFRSSRKHQIFFVNGRLIKSPLLQTAMETPYRGVLPPKKYPLGLIYLTLPPSETDINVHPAKTLIKFQDDRQIFSVVRNLINSSISAPNKILIQQPEVPGVGTESKPSFVQETFTDFNKPSFQKEFVNNQGKEALKEFASALPFLQETPKLFPRLKIVGIFKNSYILAEGNNSLFMIDQHAAHERVMFEKILQELGASQKYTQMLLEPIVIEIPHNLMPFAEEALPFLQEAGFEISDFGKTSYVIRAVPNMLAKDDINEVVCEIMKDIRENKELDKRRKKLAEKLACRAAVKLGNSLTITEAERLIQDLAFCEEPYRCPHGRPALIEIEDLQIQKWFKRVLV